MVPITDDYFAIDYVTEHRLPVILTTNSRLGSINHTLLSLEAIRSRGLELRAVIYNAYFDNDAEISADTREFVGRYLAKHFPDTEYIVMPKYEEWDV